MAAEEARLAKEKADKEAVLKKKEEELAQKRKNEELSAE